MNGFNLSDITDAKLGTTTLGSIYLGSTKLWPLGTFVKPASMTSWPANANGIPSGWTVVNV